MTVYEPDMSTEKAREAETLMREFGLNPNVVRRIEDYGEGKIRAEIIMTDEFGSKQVENNDLVTRTLLIADEEEL